MCDARSQTSFIYLLHWWHLCLSAVPSAGASVKQKRGGQRGTNAPLAPGQRAPPSLSPPLSSSFHRLCIKVALCIWKGFPLYTTQISLSPPRLTSQKTLSHLCHVREGRPSSAGLPHFSQLFLLLSCFAMPFSCLNYREGGRRRRRRWRSLIYINTDKKN